MKNMNILKNQITLQNIFLPSAVGVFNRSYTCELLSGLTI
jgi:hypothetical protein